MLVAHLLYAMVSKFNAYMDSSASTCTDSPKVNKAISLRKGGKAFSLLYSTVHAGTSTLNQVGGLPRARCSTQLLSSFPLRSSRKILSGLFLPSFPSLLHCSDGQGLTTDPIGYSDISYSDIGYCDTARSLLLAVLLDTPTQ